VLSEPQADVDDRCRRSVKKATLAVENQGTALERQESSRPLVVWQESSEPHRMWQEPPNPHVVRHESSGPHGAKNQEELSMQPSVLVWKPR
jgi:hypothetical protein